MFSIAEWILSSGFKPQVHFVWMARGQEPFATWRPALLKKMARAPNFTLHLNDTSAKEPTASTIVSRPRGGYPAQPRAMRR